MNKNQRKSHRVRIGKDVIINRTIQAEGLDICEDGMYVYTQHSFVKDAIIDLWFNIGGEKVEISAKVLHSQPGIGFGVGFFDFQTDILEKIKNYVKQQRENKVQDDE